LLRELWTTALYTVVGGAADRLDLAGSPIKAPSTPRDETYNVVIEASLPRELAFGDKFVC
jgi:hypothetical protein